MKNYLPVFRSSEGEKQVMEAYNSIMDSWPVPNEDLFIPTSLGSTHVIVSGRREAPPVVLIHAFYASAVSWYRNILSLSEHYSVYVVDIIGDPNKSKPIKPIRLISDFVDWFSELMNLLRLKQAFLSDHEVWEIGQSGIPQGFYRRPTQADINANLADIW